MSKPSRPSDPKHATGKPRTFFLTTRTASGRRLFQTERMATLFIDVLRSCVRARKFTIHDFVVMPDHVHILMTVPGDLSVEKAMQLIKGGFSFRVGRELNFHGFSDVRVSDEESFQQHQRYINHNPVKAGLANSPEEFPYGSAHMKESKRAHTKARDQAQ